MLCSFRRYDDLFFMYIYIYHVLILICMKAYHKYIHIPPTGQYNLRTLNRPEAQKIYLYRTS